MKRILIFSTTYIPFIGGSEIAIKEITDRVHDFEFEMITPRFERPLLREEMIGNVLVHRFGLGFWFDKYLFTVLGGVYAWYLHGRKKYDSAWCMEANYAGGACYLFHRITKIKYLLTLQQGDPLEQVERRARFVRKFFLDLFVRASYLQTISTYLMAWGERNGFQGDDKSVIPNGVDVSRFTANFSEENIFGMRKSFSFPSDAFILVTASRLVKKNGIADVVMALSHLPHNVCFVICGTGELADDIRALASELGVLDRLKFMGDVSHEELPLILKSSDVFVRPSLSEGLGNAFLEAMATEIVTVGTHVGGIMDFLDDGENGFVVLPENPDSIVRVILRIMNLSGGEVSSITSSARNIIERDYNWEKISNDMHGVFHTICE